MRFSFIFIIALIFLSNEARAEWDTLTCLRKCTSKSCQNPNQKKECMDNCKIDLSNCLSGDKKAKELQSQQENLRPGECMNCRTYTEGGEEHGQPITRRRVCDCKNPDGSMSQKTEDLPGPAPRSQSSGSFDYQSR